jgi:hypothetical protein
MNSILYYTKGSIATKQEQLEVAVLRKESDCVCVRNGAYRNKSNGFEKGFSKVIESGSTEKVAQRVPEKVTENEIKPAFDAKAPVAKPKPWEKNK